MEYPFKDLMPLDEVTARDGYYKDWTHIDADTFHQISELVKFIREKGYGADTREAIAQALERVYHDSTQSGNANLEVSKARNHFKDLASRLNASDDKLTSTTAQLAQTIRLDDNNLSLNNFNEHDRAVIQGLAEGEINAVLGEGNVRTENYADESITANKLSNEITKPPTIQNLIDNNRLVRGQYYNRYGDLLISENHSTTQLIPTSELKTYTRTNDYNGSHPTHNRVGNHVTFWRSDGSFVSGLDIVSRASFTVPKDTTITHMRIVVPLRVGDSVYSEEGMLVEGLELPNKYIPARHREIDITNKNIKDGEIGLSKLSNEVKKKSSPNLLNKEEFFIGYFDTLGEYVSSEINASSGLITASAGEVFSRSIGDNRLGNQITYWDSDDKFVSGEDISLQSRSFVVPDNREIAGFRIPVPLANINKPVMLVRGDKVPDTYSAYGDLKIEINAENFEKQFYKEQFLDYVKPFERVVNPVITKDIVTDRTEQTGVADPFIVLEKGVYHMFFEILKGKNPATDEVTDEIGHAFSHDLINWTYTKVVLSKQEHGHRSAYPNVFKVDGVWYMLPDVMGNVKLYKATNFPSDWELVDDLIDGRFYDTNIFKIGSNWYLTTRTGSRTGIDMYVNTSGDFKNTSWTLHPKSPIIVDSGNETQRRGGGKMIEKDGYVYFPVQTSVDGSYGARLYLYKLSGISPTEVTATRMLTLFEDKKDGSWSDMIQHHICDVDYLNSKAYAVDGHLSGEYAIGLYVSN